VARRGAAIEYDGIGRRWRPQGSDDGFVQLVMDALNAGLTDRLLLSQDLIGYDPALPGGGDPQPYAYLTEVFLPRLRAAGVDEDPPYHLGQPVAHVWARVNDPRRRWTR
jgi:phosphotriesterase-related protein